VIENCPIILDRNYLTADKISTGVGNKEALVDGSVEILFSSNTNWANIDIELGETKIVNYVVFLRHNIDTRIRIYYFRNGSYYSITSITEGLTANNIISFEDQVYDKFRIECENTGIVQIGELIMSRKRFQFEYPPNNVSIIKKPYLKTYRLNNGRIVVVQNDLIKYRKEITLSWDFLNKTDFDNLEMLSLEKEFCLLLYPDTNPENSYQCVWTENIKQKLVSDYNRNAGYDVSITFEET